MFKVYANKGFQMTFENGWTVSVMFGSGNYCSRRYNTSIEMPKNEYQSHKSKDAEITAWDINNNWFEFEDDEVKGYVSTNELSDFIQMIKNK